MNLFQRAIRSCFRKPVKSLLLLLVVCIISLLFLSGMASRSANIATKDSTRQAIGAGFLLEYNPENRSQRVDEACQKISELYPDGQGSYGGVHQEKLTVMGSESWTVTTDNSFESLKSDDIEKIARNYLVNKKIIRIGQITKIIQEKKCGFIKINDENDTIYFKIKDIKNGFAEKNKYAEFEIIEYEDKKRAINIKVIRG